MTNSSICHPAHYCQYPLEVIELCRHLDFCLGNVVKYVLRAPFKNGEEDYDKALEYLKIYMGNFAHSLSSAHSGAYKLAVSDFEDGIADNKIAACKDNVCENKKQPNSAESENGQDIKCSGLDRLIQKAQIQILKAIPYLYKANKWEFKEIAFKNYFLNAEYLADLIWYLKQRLYASAEEIEFPPKPNTKAYQNWQCGKHACKDIKEYREKLYNGQICIFSE